jgi:hypothetical protein
MKFLLRYLIVANKEVPNKSLENRRENAGAFPASQLQRSVMKMEAW